MQAPYTSTNLDHIATQNTQPAYIIVSTAGVNYHCNYHQLLLSDQVSNSEG